MVFIKKVINADPGTADLVGGNDWDKLDDFHDDIDITPIVGKFNTETRWRSGKRKLMNPANTFAYIETASAIVANAIVLEPLLATDDERVYKNHPVTLNSKTLSNSCIVKHINEDLNLAGDITPSQITSNQNNYSPTGLATATRLRLSTDASRNITGLALGADGRVNIIDNVGSNDIVLTNQDTASTDINRFLLGANLTIPADRSVTLIYDSTTLRWRVNARTTNIGTTNIENDAVTHAKYQNIASDRLLGRDTASSGDPEEITVTGGLEFSGSTSIQRSALTGDVTASAGSNSTTIANDAVSYAKMQNVSAASKLLGRGDSGSGDPQEITLGSGLSMSGTTISASGGGSGIQNLSQSNAEINVVNTVTETDILNYSVLANTLGTSKKIKVEILFDYLNNSGSARTFDLKGYFGGVNLFAETSISVPADVDVRTGTLFIQLWNLTATNANRLKGWMIMSGGSAPTTGIIGNFNAATDDMQGHFTANNGTSDTTSNQTLRFTITHSTNNANLSFKVVNTSIVLYG